MNTSSRQNRTYRAGTGMALLTAFLTVWGTVVHDDGNGAGFFLVILAGLVGAFAAWFDSAGMARAMWGTAVLQVIYGIALATAPSTAQTPGGPQMAMIFSCSLAVGWLVSGALFRVSARGKAN